MFSTHVMTETGEAIVKAFYGEDAKRCYYTECSTGGQQGLIEAHCYPDDYSGGWSARHHEPDLGPCSRDLGLSLR